MLLVTYSSFLQSLKDSKLMRSYGSLFMKYIYMGVVCLVDTDLPMVDSVSILRLKGPFPLLGLVYVQ